jgi:hypothetical protein
MSLPGALARSNSDAGLLEPCDDDGAADTDVQHRLGAELAVDIRPAILAEVDGVAKQAVQRLAFPLRQVSGPRLGQHMARDIVPDRSSRSLTLP